MGISVRGRWHEPFPSFSYARGEHHGRPPRAGLPPSKVRFVRLWRTRSGVSPESAQRLMPSPPVVMDPNAFRSG